MASLIECLKLIADVEIDRKALMKSAETLRKTEGYDPHNANVQAVKDAVFGLDTDKEGILKQIREIVPKPPMGAGGGFGVEKAPELTLGRLGGRAVETLKEQVRAAGTTMEATGKMMGERKFPLLPHQRDAAEQFGKFGEVVGKKIADLSFLQPKPEYRQSSGYIEDLTGGVTQAIPQMIAHYTGGKILTLPIMFSHILGTQYEQLTNEGVTPTRAFTAAFINAAVQTPMEQLSLSRMANVFKPRKMLIKRLKAWVEGVGTEGATEFFQKAPEYLTNIYAENADKTMLKQVEIALDPKNIKQALKEATREGLVGAGVGAIVGGAGTVVSTAVAPKEEVAVTPETEKAAKPEVPKVKEVPIGQEKLDQIKTILAERNLGIKDEKIALEEIKKQPEKPVGQFVSEWQVQPEGRVGIVPTTPELITLTKKEPALTVKEMVEEEGEVRAYEIGKRDARIGIYKKIKAKKAQVEEIRKDILTYATQNLTEMDKKQVRLMAQGAKTQKQMGRVLQKIDKMEQKYQRKTAVDSLKETVKKIDFKKLRKEYKPTITEIVGSIDLVNRTDKTIKRLNKLVDHLVRHPEDTNVPQEQLTKLAQLGQTEIKDLTTDDIRLIDTSIKSLVKQHDLKGKLIIKGKLREFKDVLDKSITNLQKSKRPERKPRESGDVNRVRRFFGTESTNVEHLSKELDYGDHKEIKEVVYDGIDKGVSTTLGIRQAANDFFDSKLKGVDLSGMSEAFHIQSSTRKFIRRIRGKDPVDYTEHTLSSGEKIILSPGEKIALNLHGRNEDSLQHLLDGGFRDVARVRHKITSEDLDMLTKLTSQEQKVADSIYEYFNTVQKETLNKVSMELNGWEIATEENYYPIQVFREAIQKNYLEKGEMLPADMKKFMQFTLEGMGIFKERTGSNKEIILEDAFVTVGKSIQKASAYAGLASPLRNAKALVNHGDFRDQVRKNYRPDYLTALDNYLRDIEGDYQRTDNMDSLLQASINKLDSAFLGYNPWVMAKQPISYMLASKEIDGKYLAKAALTKGASNEVMMKNSSQIRDRLEGNVTRELGEVANVGKVRQFFLHKHTLNQNTMLGIRRADTAAIRRIYKAAEFETSDLHPELKGEAKEKHIAERAEEIIRRTQPTFHNKDRSEVGRSKSTVVRLLTKYSSQRNKNFMMQRDAIIDYSRSKRTLKDKAKLTKVIVMTNVVNALALYGIDELRNLAYGRDEPEKKNKYRMLRFAEYALGNIYLVGNAMRQVARIAEKGKFGVGSQDILSSTAMDAWVGIASIINAAEQAVSGEVFTSGEKKDERKWIDSLLRGTEKLTKVGLHVLKGLPYATVKKLITAPIKLFEEEKETATYSPTSTKKYEKKLKKELTKKTFKK